MAEVAKNLESLIAHMPGVNAEVKRVAQAGLSIAKGKAAAHRDTGAFAQSLKLERGRTDWYIVATDPNSASIEFGHHDAKTGKFIPGLHILGSTAADIGGP